MMFIKRVLLMLILGTILMTGCADQGTLSDSQYTYIQHGSAPTIAESDDGYYFTMGMYLFYMDKHNMEPVPLCNQAACLHNKEVDPRMVQKCDAFLGENNGIFYNDNEIYAVLSTSSVYSNNNQIIKITPDGTSRKTVCSFDGLVGTTALHRGYFYFAYSKWDSDQNYLYGINRIQLNSFSPKESEVYKGTLTDGAINNIIAYRDNLYLLDFSHFINPVVDHYIRYDLTTGESQPLFNLPMNTKSSTPAITGDKLHYLLFSLPPNNARIIPPHYMTQLDGSQSTESFDVEKFNTQLHSDGEYFFEFDTAWYDDPPPPEEQMLRVLSAEGEILHSINIGDLDVYRSFISGGKDHLFIKTQTAETLKLFYMDKSFQTENPQLQLAFSVDRNDCYKSIVSGPDS